MKKTTKLVGEEVQTAGQQHIVDTLLSELYGIKVPQAIVCEDCGNKFTLQRRKYVIRDDETMAQSVVQSKEQMIRARYAPIKGTFPVRVFTLFYFDCPFCKKRFFSRIIDPKSFNALDRRGFFDVIDIFEKGLFVLPKWKQIEVFRMCKDFMSSIEKRTTGLKFEDKNTGIAYKLEYFHG